MRNMEMPFKTSQLFDEKIDTRRVLLLGGAEMWTQFQVNNSAHSKLLSFYINLNNELHEYIRVLSILEADKDLDSSLLVDSVQKTE